MLQRPIDEHRTEVARLRAEFGDPVEGPAAFVREHFDEAALTETVREVLEGRGSIWNESDVDGRDGRRRRPLPFRASNAPTWWRSIHMSSRLGCRLRTTGPIRQR